MRCRLVSDVFLSLLILYLNLTRIGPVTMG